MSSLSKDKSTVMSVRVPNDLRDEFIALARATGTQTSRKLREVFDMALENMRHEVNEKRSVHDGESWEAEWSRLKGDA